MDSVKCNRFWNFITLGVYCLHVTYGHNYGPDSAHVSVNEITPFNCLAGEMDPRVFFLEHLRGVKMDTYIC